MYAGGKFAQILLFFTPVAIITSVLFTRRDDRVVEGNGLENRRAGNGTVGSNPTLSAKLTNATPSDRITASIPVKREKSSPTKCEPFCRCDEKNRRFVSCPGEVPKWLKGTVC